MDQPNEIYYKAMFETLEAIRDDRFKSGHYDEGPNLMTDNLAYALISTGHEALTSVLLGEKPKYPISSEVINGYLLSGDYEEILNMFKKHGLQPFNFDHDEFIFNLIGSNSSDALILEYARILYEDKGDRYSSSSSNKFYLRCLVEESWEVGRYELTKKILDSFFDPKEANFMFILEKLNKGEQIDPKEILAAFNAYCPLKQCNERHSFLRDSDLTKFVSYFISKLMNSETPPVDLIETAYGEFQKRVATNQMESFYLDNKWEIERTILKSILEKGDFEKAEIFINRADSKSYELPAFLIARIRDAIKRDDREAHEVALEKYLDFSKEKNPLDKHFEDDPKMSWHTRISRYESEAVCDAERAIFELIHGTDESAKPHIDRMIETVEQIGVPGKPECPIKHQKTLRKHRKLAKRGLRERFWKLGLLDKLPALHGWNNEIQKSGEEKAENRAEGKSKTASMMERNEEHRAQRKKEKEALSDAVRKMLETDGVDAAIAFLKDKKFYRAEYEDWEIGIIILEADPSKFQELLGFLGEGFFERRDYIIRDLAHDGLAAFYTAGDRLGVVSEKDWLELFDKWRNSCWGPDGDSPMPGNGILGMVKGLVGIGKWEKAMSYFRELQLQKRPKVNRKTKMDGYTFLVRHAAERIRGIKNGAAFSFKGEGLPENASKRQQIEYWNTEVECLLQGPGDDLHNDASFELLKLLDDPESVRLWVRMLALGSVRTHHQKKDALLEVYSFEGQLAESRWAVVESMIEHKIPGAESMPDIKSKDTPEEVALNFFKKLVEKDFLHKHTLCYLDPENLPYLRSLLSQHQNQFNTVMEVIEGDLNEKARLELNEWPGIFTILDKVGALTPGVYAQAKACNFNKKELAKIGERLAELRKDLFSNRPIDPTITPELVAELVYMAYQPANMSFSTALGLCGEVEDCSHHLEDYKIDEDGYPLDLTANRAMRLVEGSNLSTSKYISMDMTIASRETEISRSLFKIGRFKMDDISMDYLLSIFFNNSFVRKAVKTWETAKTDNDSYRALRVLQEAFGVYLDDNLENMLFGFFKKRKKFLSIMLGNFTKTLKKPGRRFALKNQLGIELDDTQSDVEIAAKVISQAIIKKFKPLADLRKSIVDDLRQFTVAGEQEALAPDVRLKAVISKNAASFFAKASAGICTDRDVDLFHREDHFHINIIDDDKKKCVGNVQAYIMQHEGHPYLLLRGFNPSTNLLKTVDAGSLCESIISVGRQFVRDNDLAGVLLSEQGGFLALSNRPDVKKYLEKRYGSNIIPISDFKISSFSTIKAAFNIDAPPSKNIPKNLRKRINPDDGYMSMVG